MAPLSLDGDTLGEKQKYFNKLVQDSADNKHFNLTALNNDNNDIDNLLNIEIACKTRNVEYILDVLKCEDMLYVSRAIKHSRWLITEQQYAHIINPQYLYTQLFPHMLTKAVNKLLLNIRLHLNDEKRYETFYLYLKDTARDAYKWLLHCSLPFVENIVQNERQINLQLFIGLCKRSVKFLSYYTKIENRNDWRAFNDTLFLLHTNAEEFFDVLDKLGPYTSPAFEKKYTEVIMKKCPERILNNFEKYYSSVDLPTLAKYLKKDEIKDFLLKHTKNQSIRYIFDNFNNMKAFINNMPYEDRFEFVKQVYIDKKEITPPASGVTPLSCEDLANLSLSSTKKYQWYQYAPFNVALTELKKLIRAENSPTERSAIMVVLVSCARKNLQNMKLLLQFYYEKHRNEPFKFKVQFVNKLIAEAATHEFDNETWNILDMLFHSLEVYIPSNNDVQMCLKSIIIYKVLHNENVPEIVEKKLEFDTFKNFQAKLNQEQQDKIFSYLFNSVSVKIQNKTIENEKDCQEIYNLIQNALKLIIDWKKDPSEYLFLRDKVKELLKINKEHSWCEHINFNELYNMNKLWRRYLFEESLMMCPTEEVCLNVLKHKPHLLLQYNDHLKALRENDDVTLHKFLTKLRIYWTNSLAQEWTKAYMNNLDEDTGHKALVNGAFALLPQKQLIDMAKKYAPKDTKIDWSEINQKELSLAKNIARSLYTARPLPSLDIVLSYSKGDYLQYTVPSLSSILHNISKTQSRQHIPTLLEAPVSLQKYGLHLAFVKLNTDELKPIFLEIWKTSKNLSIKTCLFTYTYNSMCKVKDPTVIKELWEVLSSFIGNLTAEENKTIFKKLANAKKVPTCIRGEFFTKSYTYLSSLPASANAESSKDTLIKDASRIMNLLDGDFVANKMLAPVEENITKIRTELINTMSSYVLHGKTEDEQCDRYKRVLIPALKQIILSWDMTKDEEYVMQVNLETLLRALVWDMRKYITVNKIIVPVKLFSEVRAFMEQNMNNKQNYVRLTTWKMMTEYVKLIEENKDMLCDFKEDDTSDVDYCLLQEDEKIWEIIHTKISPQMGQILVKHLKEDIDKYFPSIHWLFGSAIGKMFAYLTFSRSSMEIETLKYMIVDSDHIPSYLVVCEELPKYGDDNDRIKRKEVRRMLMAHPSQEVQMHYEKAFAEIYEIIREDD